MADYISIIGKKSKYSIKLSGKSDKVIEEIKKFTNEKGYFNFELCERKEVGKYDETHYVKVDTYRPKSDGEKYVKEKEQFAKREVVKTTTRDGITTEDIDGLTFTLFAIIGLSSMLSMII